MKRRALGAIGAAALAVGVIAPAAASADSGNGLGDCHADWLQTAKSIVGTHSAAATAAGYGFTVQQGQELIGVLCGQS